MTSDTSDKPYDLDIDAPADGERRVPRAPRHGRTRVRRERTRDGYLNRMRLFVGLTILLLGLIWTAFDVALAMKLERHQHGPAPLAGKALVTAIALAFGCWYVGLLAKGMRHPAGIMLLALFFAVLSTILVVAGVLGLIAALFMLNWSQ